MAGRLSAFSVLVCAVVVAAATPALAAPNQVDLGNPANIRFSGENLGDVSGYRVAAVGDVNGDGHDDVAIQANGDPAGVREGGSVFVVYGGSGPVTDLDLG